MVPASFSGGDALLLAGDDEERQDRQHRAVHGHRHASSGRAGCRRTACACRRSNRSPRRPCRRRRARADGRCRSRGGWRGRRRPTGPSARRRGCGGRRRWSPRPWRSRRTGGWSTAASRTWWGTGRAGKAQCPGRCRGSRASPCRRPCRPASARCPRASCTPRRRRPERKPEPARGALPRSILVKSGMRVMASLPIDRGRLRPKLSQSGS